MKKNLSAMLDEDLYYQLKKALKEKGMTISGWIYVKAKEEINNK